MEQTILDPLLQDVSNKSPKVYIKKLPKNWVSPPKPIVMEYPYAGKRDRPPKNGIYPPKPKPKVIEYLDNPYAGTLDKIRKKIRKEDEAKKLCDKISNLEECPSETVLETDINPKVSYYADSTREQERIQRQNDIRRQVDRRDRKHFRRGRANSSDRRRGQRESPARRRSQRNSSDRRRSQSNSSHRRQSRTKSPACRRSRRKSSSRGRSHRNSQRNSSDRQRSRTTSSETSRSSTTSSERSQTSSSTSKSSVSSERPRRRLNSTERRRIRIDSRHRSKSPTRRRAHANNSGRSHSRSPTRRRTHANNSGRRRSRTKTPARRRSHSSDNRRNSNIGPPQRTSNRWPEQQVVMVPIYMPAPAPYNMSMNERMFPPYGMNPGNFMTPSFMPHVHPTPNMMVPPNFMMQSFHHGPRQRFRHPRPPNHR